MARTRRVSRDGRGSGKGHKLDGGQWIRDVYRHISVRPRLPAVVVDIVVVRRSNRDNERRDLCRHWVNLHFRVHHVDFHLVLLRLRENRRIKPKSIYPYVFPLDQGVGFIHVKHLDADKINRLRRQSRKSLDRSLDRVRHGSRDQLSVFLDFHVAISILH